MSRSIEHTKTFPSSTACLEDVRRFVEAHAQEADLAEGAVEHFKIAVDEACTNVIKHAYKGDARRQFDVAIIVADDRFTVSIRDEGEAFREDFYREPDLRRSIQKKKGGGLGVFLMRQLMDRVEYKKRGAVNEVNLTKYRTPETIRNGEM